MFGDTASGEIPLHRLIMVGQTKNAVINLPRVDTMGETASEEIPLPRLIMVGQTKNAVINL
mgnify:FL=1